MYLYNPCIFANKEITTKKTQLVPIYIQHAIMLNNGYCPVVKICSCIQLMPSCWIIKDLHGFVFWFCHDVELMNEDLFVHLILVDDSRVVLNEVEGEEGSDYINASYILVSKTVTKALKVTPKKYYSWLSWSPILSLLIFKKWTWCLPKLYEYR